MEVEDHLRSSCEKGEFGDLSTDQEIEAPQAAPVPVSSTQELPVHSRILKGPVVPNWFQQEVPVSSRTPKGPTDPDKSQWEVSVLSRNLQGATVSDASQKQELCQLGLHGGRNSAVSFVQAPVPAASPEEAPVLARTLQGATAANGSLQGAPVPARPSLCRKLRVPETMRQYVTRNIILTPLPLRQPMGRPTSSRTPVSTASPEQSLSVAYPEDAPDLSRTPEDTPMPGVSPKAAPLPASSPLKSSVLVAYTEEAPILTTSPEGAPLPARSSKGAHVPAASLEAAPVPVSSNQELPVPSRILKGPVVPNGTKQEVSVSSSTPKGPTDLDESQWEVYVLSRNLQGATVTDGSQQEAHVPARPPWRQKLRVPENMRQYLTRKSILTSLPIRQPMGRPIPAASYVQAPVPAASPEEAPVLARILQGPTAANGSQQGAPVSARPSLCRKLRVPENMRQYVTRNIILTPFPLRQPMGRPTSSRAPFPTASSEQPLSAASPVEAPVPARSNEGAPMSCASPREIPVPPTSPEGVPVLSALQEEVPVPAGSSEGAAVSTVPARSYGESARPIRSHKRAHRLTTCPQGSPQKRSSPWSNEASDKVGMVQLPPLKKKQCMKEDCTAFPSSQHNLKRLCPWTIGDSDDGDVHQPPPLKKRCVRKAQYLNSTPVKDCVRQGFPHQMKEHQMKKGP
ncbi:mucin-17-like [Carassius gibelio]|uniref:mucin-17-like n=1 Tax=Carassius gibelio TaxID=101364 RepID=UPI00227838D7|nr:mucin-17-like [Carassius gibelio]